MKKRTPPSSEEIERMLIADAENPDAWEEPITVSPSSSARPSSYRQSDLEATPQTLVASTVCSVPELHVLGELAMWFANLEMYVEFGIWQLVAGNDQEQRELIEPITAEMSFDRKVHAFGSVYKQRYPDEADDPELSAIIKELFIAQEERNAILHSAWSYSPKESSLFRMKASAKAKHGLQRRLYAMPADRLTSVRDHVGEVGQRFARFCMKRIQSRIEAQNNDKASGRVVLE